MKIDRHVYSRVDLKWDGLKLRLKSGRLLVTVEPDPKWPKMYRVRTTNGRLTDMTNITWAKDAAIALRRPQPEARYKPGRGGAGEPKRLSRCVGCREAARTAQIVGNVMAVTAG